MVHLPPFETMAVALTMAPLFATAAAAAAVAADTFPNDANGRGNILWTEECFTRQFRAEWDYSVHEGTVQVADARIRLFQRLESKIAFLR